MELTPAEARHVVDELADMKVFYVNIGGGEPMLRPDFFDLVGYAVDKKVGVKFSTNGTRLTAERARRLAGMDYVDVQISIDGALASTNDAVRGEGSFAAARTAMDNLAAAELRPVQDQRGGHSGERHAARPVLRHRRELRRPAPADEVPPLGPRRRDLGPAPSRRPSSSGCCTTGCSIVPMS